MIKNIIKINSNTIIAQVHSDDFRNEITEVEKIAEELDIYGSVMSYKTEKIGNYTNIIFKTME